MTPIEQTVERIKQIRWRFGQALQPPAGNASIDRLVQQCKSRFGLIVPNRYLSLLRLADGVEDNGARFYASVCRPFVDHPDREFASVIDETARWWFQRQQLMLGNNEDQLFRYDHTIDEYHVWDINSSAAHRRFKTFDELFSYAFSEGRLHLPDLPPPPKWSDFD